MTPPHSSTLHLLASSLWVQALQRAGDSRQAPSNWGIHVPTCVSSLYQTTVLWAFMLRPSASPSTVLPDLRLHMCDITDVQNSCLVNSRGVIIHPQL